MYIYNIIILHHRVRKFWSYQSLGNSDKSRPIWGQRKGLWWQKKQFLFSGFFLPNESGISGRRSLLRQRDRRYKTCASISSPDKHKNLCSLLVQRGYIKNYTRGPFQKAQQTVWWTIVPCYSSIAQSVRGPSPGPTVHHAFWNSP